MRLSEGWRVSHILHKAGRRRLPLSLARTLHSSFRREGRAPAALCSDQVLSVSNAEGGGVGASAVSAPVASEQALLASICPPALHLSTERWVVFSDLHVKASSVDTCEEVLQYVHDQAVERDAGIIFLGDFWHVRGVLSVELLNRVLSALKKWTRPVIMIPGNHDQVTLGGMVHALEPLMYAFQPEQALLISEPAVCMNALWMPYRRDRQLMASALRSAARRDDISMIFCHADVKGAYMNDGVASKEGIDVETFPPNLPILSGHFHKPHTVAKNNVHLRYVGSPYQTSLSEADQAKFLYLLSSRRESTDPQSRHVWKEEEHWPMSFGRKYFRVQGLSDPKLGQVRPGDRVVLTVDRESLDGADTLAYSLRGQGVEVEVRTDNLGLIKPTSLASAEDQALLSSNEAADSSENVWALGQEGVSTESCSKLFERYVSCLSVDDFQHQIQADSAIADQSYWEKYKASLLQSGKQLLEQLVDRANVPVSVGHPGEGRDLMLKRVHVQNFGPYGERTAVYPLDKRGLVLIQGRIEDDSGADSNGAGKTTLAMSVMWCLTGSMDTRIIADGKSADVVFDTLTEQSPSKGANTAEVRLEGTINGKPFELVRRKSAKKSELTFHVDGHDLTTLSVKDTQRCVEDTLGTGNGLLQRCCFFGQHSHTHQALLGLQDARFKEELAKLVDISIWAEAAREARAIQKACDEQIGEINLTMKIRQKELQSATQAVMTSKEELAKIGEDVAKRQEVVQSKNMALEDAILAVNETEFQLTSLQEHAVQSKERMEAIRKELYDHLVDVTEHETEGSALLDLRNQWQQQTVARETLLAVHQTWMQLLSFLDQEVQSQVEEQQRALAATTMEAGSLLSLTEGLEDDCDRAQTWSLEKWFDKMVDLAVQVGELDLQIASKNATYQELRRLAAKGGGVDTSSGGATDHCASRNQSLPPLPSNPIHRVATAQEELAALLQARNDLQRDHLAKKAVVHKQYDARAGARHISSLRRICSLVEVERSKVEESLQQCESRCLATQAQMESLQQAEAQALAHRESERARLEQQLANAQESIKDVEGQVRSLQEKLKLLQKEKLSLFQQQSNEQYHVGLFQNRKGYAQANLREKSRVVEELTATVNECVEQKAEAMEKAAVHGQLANLFGPRGVQNFLFSGVLRQLEDNCNLFLSALSDGAIKVSIRSDDEGERILKTVLMKSSPLDSPVTPLAPYKERSLSLLSGGQWRRVSFALDLAFTEMVRKAGLLRCNLLVMDEVLSHLDAAGRQAVGDVLRSLVSRSPTSRTTQGMHRSRQENVVVVDTQTGAEESRAGPGSTPASSLWEASGRMEVDRYETILVILQDIVATELEESFDHIDTVVRSGSTARIEIDGLEEMSR